MRYGKWAGNPEGISEHSDRCIQEVWGNGYISRQCSRDRGFGPGKKFCKQHGKKIEKKLSEVFDEN